MTFVKTAFQFAKVMVFVSLLHIVIYIKRFVWSAMNRIYIVKFE